MWDFMLRHGFDEENEGVRMMMKTKTKTNSIVIAIVFFGECVYPFWVWYWFN